MIVVIADDFTGAAEIAGIARQAGFKEVVLTNELNMVDVRADVLVVNSNTRSMQQSDAIHTAQNLASQVQAIQPTWLYVKIDSVLRGHVAEELKIYQSVLNVEAAVVMPANPTLGRTIESGYYYVNGLLVNHTAFAHDPEFPKKSADVLDMLGDVAPLRAIHYKRYDGWNKGDVLLFDARKLMDIQTLVGHIHSAPLLMIGGGDFFLALLEAKFSDRLFCAEEKTPLATLPKLLVSGTTYRQSVEAIQRLKENGTPVFYIAPDRASVEDTAAIVSATTKEDLTIMCFNQYGLSQNLDANALRLIMAEEVVKVIKHADNLDIYIEGGATAAAILELLEANTFTIVQTFARGVVQMRTNALPMSMITVKPGSYAWHKGFLN